MSATYESARLVLVIETDRDKLFGVPDATLLPPLPRTFSHEEVR